QAVGDLPEGAPHVSPPRPVDVVLEPARRGDADRMADPGTGDDLPVPIGGDGLDRRGADVDPDRDLGASPHAPSPPRRPGSDRHLSATGFTGAPTARTNGSGEASSRK